MERTSATVLFIVLGKLENSWWLWVGRVSKLGGESGVSAGALL
jgi:hypothetical protein